jgi:exopolysaccharide production protein ExoQ
MLLERMTKSPTYKRIEGSCLWLAAFVFSGALLPLLLANGEQNSTEGDRPFQLVLAIVYLAVISLAVAQWGKTRWGVGGTLVIFALLLLACLSALWAETPGLVLRRSLALVGTSMFGVVLGTRLDFSAQLKLLRGIFRLIAALSVICIAFLPQYGIAIGAHEGAWQGIFNHKNPLGAYMALATVVEWYLPTKTLGSKLARVAWICLYLVLIFFSNSITSMVTLVVTLAIMQSFKMLRLWVRVPVPIWFTIVFFGGVALTSLTLNFDAISLLGRTSTLTGRTDLWRWVATMIARKPMLGYGFSGFWGGASSESTLVQSRVHWSAIYAHNGYLEIALSLGLVGLLLILWFIGQGLRRALLKVETERSVESLWPLAFLVFFLIHNIAECTIMWQNSLEWALCVATVIRCDPRFNEAIAGDARETDVMAVPTEEYA